MTQRCVVAEGTLVVLVALLGGCGHLSNDAGSGGTSNVGGSAGLAGSGNTTAGSAGNPTGGSAGKGSGGAGNPTGGSAGKGSGGAGNLTGGSAGKGGAGGNAGQGNAGGSSPTGGQAAGGSAGNPGGGTAAGEAGAGGGESGPLHPLIVAFCGAARACCSRAGQPVQALAACEVQFPSVIDPVALIDKGTVRVNDLALSKCVAAYQQATTGCTLTEVLGACRGILVGTVADGQPCVNVMECDRTKGPKVCLVIQGDPAGAGTCMTPPRGTSGTPCAQSCENGADCSSTNSSPDTSFPIALCYEADGLYCPIGESCAPIVADGEACQWNEACGSDGFCGSSCDTLSGTGDACQFNFGCSPGLACESGHCAAEPLANSDVCVGHPPDFN